jgi:hypothetical protein
MTSRKQNTSQNKGGAQVDRAGGPNATGQNKVFKCSVAHISKLRRELQQRKLALRGTSGRTQRDALVPILQYLGERGINTPEAVGVGFYRIATRIQELEADGWLVDSKRERLQGADGLTHDGIARYVLKGRRTCLDSWDHVPMRSWPLFKARDALRTMQSTTTHRRLHDTSPA